MFNLREIMGFKSSDQGIAASIYLVLYFFFAITALSIVIKKGIKTFYSSLLFFGTIRVGAQLCGVAFACLGIDHWQWLVGYLVLGAEGYFALILAGFHCLSHCLQEEYGYSWLNNRLLDDLRKSDGPRIERKGYRFSWFSMFHWVLIVGNVLIISGGSMLTSININEYDKYQDKVRISKGLRTTGQVLFLFLTVMLIVCVSHTVLIKKIRSHAVFAIIATIPFLTVRGIYGILSCVITKMNYYMLSNYNEDGLSTYFVATEYCMSTTMEFISATILLATYFIENYLQKNNRMVAKKQTRHEKFEEESF